MSSTENSGMANTSLANKRVLLGITGGIAAYKSADLLRRLQTAGAEVRVVMTQAATEFITPLTFQALSGHPVHLDLLDTEAEAGMGHIELARWADIILVAPASADFIARLVHGEAGDLLSTLCLARTGPLAVAPAMNQAMWSNMASQHNIETLQQRNIHVFGPASGYQACGDIGEGRMEAPERLLELIKALFNTASLAGQKLVITAGPTREALDPVRYLSNHSSGKMGYALAEAAAEAGAETVLISGPVALAPPPRVRTIAVTSAQQMLEVTLQEVDKATVFIAAAAVADYRPVTLAEQKIKKSTETLSLELEKTTDIVATVAALEKRPFTVGFAAETENLVSYARGKLERKQLDLVIANDVSDTTIGFGSDDNRVVLVTSSGEEELAKMNKSQLARELIQFISARLPLN